MWELLDRLSQLMQETLHPSFVMRWIGASLAVSGLVSCSPVPFPMPPGYGVVQAVQQLGSAKRPSRGDNWPLLPGEARAVLTQGELELRSLKPLSSGVTGADKVTAYVPAYGKEIEFKWKLVPEGSADGVNNSPRKEIVANMVQQWFLDADDYVVPTSVARCIPTDVYRKLQPDARPNIPGTDCILGNASIWLENVALPREPTHLIHVFCSPFIYDETRFLSDPNYAYHLSNFNLLTYLIMHRDGRCGNFLISKDKANQRIFAVDNGISFDSFWYRNYGTANWESIFVPALRRDAIDRLRRLTRTDLDRLAVAVELRADERGILRTVSPGPTMDPSKGARVAPGRIQFGLTTSEIDGLEKRILALLEQVDLGNLATF